MNTSAITRKICRIIVGITIANFISFAVIAIYFGGDAMNGKQVAGHFYVGVHGQFNEVSKSVFMYSQLHIYILILNYVMAAPAAIYLYKLDRSQGV